MSAHTPGPWWHSGLEVGTEPVMAVKVARVSGATHDEARANARLIAAAPALLAKLEQLAGECAECRGTGFAVLPFSGGQSSRARCPDCADIRAVIARATQP